MNYRCMQISDHDTVMQLWCDCEGLLLRDADSKSAVGRYLARNPGLSFVAEDDDRIVGSIMAGHDARRGYIQHLAVAEDTRRQGVASRLIELCLDALKAQGIEKSHVHVLKNNRSGRRYWAKRGWSERCETILYSYVNGENENA
ncbi:MAG: GNAT family N-acetyltransferase [Gammaproteobacteria bacterium]|nr:MAG: GNAT family N-acetyltransferase [Gammaproteobacteria bacterium]